MNDVKDFGQKIVSLEDVLVFQRAIKGIFIESKIYVAVVLISSDTGKHFWA